MGRIIEPGYRLHQFGKIDGRNRMCIPKWRATRSAKPRLTISSHPAVAPALRLAALEITVTLDGRGYVATVAGLRAQLNETHACIVEARTREPSLDLGDVNEALKRATEALNSEVKQCSS
jgi:hypothetical protein